MSVALELMRDRSYGAVGVETICQKAGVNKGSFYYYFPSKAELGIAALEASWAWYQTTVLEPAFQPNVSPLDQLGRYLDANYRMQKQTHKKTGHVCGCLFGSLGCEVSNQEEGIRSKIDEILFRFHLYFETMLVAAKSAGQIELTDIKTTVKAIIAFIEGMLLQAKISNNAEVVRELTPHVFRLIGAKENFVPKRNQLGRSSLKQVA